jgi:DNA-binding Lrp family transcriptional regulator
MLDDTDRALIAALQTNARESVSTLARKLGVARTTVLARMQRLETQGVITGYSVKLDQSAAYGGLTAYVGLSVSPKAGREVTRRLMKMPEVMVLSSVSGEFDYVALLRAPSSTQLDALLDQIGELDGVTKTTTSVVLAEKVNRLG